MMENTKINVDLMIEDNLKSQAVSYLEEAEKSVRFETNLRDCVNRKKAINLRRFVVQELNSNVCMFGVPVMTLLSPDFVLDRYFMSSMALSLALNGLTSYSLVYANFENFASYERLQYLASDFEAKKYNTCQEHLAWFIETDTSVFFPLFNFIVTKPHFYKMMGVKVLNKYSNLELMESSMYQEFVACQNKINKGYPVWNQEEVLSFIDDYIIGSLNSSPFKIMQIKNERIKELEYLIYNALNLDRKQIGKAIFNLSSGQAFGEHMPGENLSVDSDFYEIIKIILQDK